jgi:hypothetical protein
MYRAVARGCRWLAEPNVYVAGQFTDAHQNADLFLQRCGSFTRLDVLGRDLSIFARALQQDEREGRTWHYGGVENIMPALKCDSPGATHYSSETVLMELRQFLAVAPVAWRDWLTQD